MGKIKSIYNYYLSKDHDLVGFWEKNKNHKEISKTLKKDFFELNDDERNELPIMIEVAKNLIEKDHKPDGYNIGMNCGEAAGQTVMHFHCHVIPRYLGDMENPRGGIRHCVRNKGYY